jgi:hypothetical protein
MIRRILLLRIAASLVCGVACLLLTVLWIVSYVRMDQVLAPISKTQYVGCTSAVGELRFGKSNDPVLGRLFNHQWARRGFPLRNWETGPRGGPFFPASVPEPQDRKWITWLRLNRNFSVLPPGVTHDELIVPYWCLVLPFAALSTIPWIQWPHRFSLRTLLLATTLVAVALAIAMR